MLKNFIWGWGLDPSGSGCGLVAGSCEHDNTPFGSKMAGILWQAKWFFDS